MKTTSKKAYVSILPDLPRRQRQVYRGISKIGKGTFREIASAAGVPESTAWKRLPELRKKGLVKDESKTICKISGRLVTLWELA